MLIIGDSPLYSNNENSISYRSSFNSPDIAIMNAVKTPQLEATEIISSDDYHKHQSIASSGYSPDGENENNCKFKITGD